MIPNKIVTILTLLASFGALACPLSQVEDGMRTNFTCDSSGQVIVTETYLVSSGTLSFREKRVSENRKEQESFNVEGDRVSHTAIETLKNGDERRASLDLKTGIISLVETFRGKKKIAQEFYREGKLQMVEELDNLERPTRRQLVRGAHITGSAEFTYRPGTGRNDRVLKSMRLLDSKGAVISNFEEGLAQPTKNSKFNEVAMVMDTGFDVHHPAIAPHLFVSEKNASGWNSVRRSTDLADVLRVSLSEAFPMSHGTHVASIALRDLSQTGFMGISGFADRLAFERASEIIRDERIRFVNMSFGWAGDDEFMGPGSAATAALTRMIEEHPKTMFVVAAGNSPDRLKLGELGCDVPVCLVSHNLLRVAAWNAADVSADGIPTPGGLSDFTSYGEDVVDIAAPGVKVPGGLIGGGWLPMSGTSMAAPFAMNVLLKMAEKNPELSAATLKEILLKTAWIENIDHPIPVRAGGVVFPKRAEAVVLEMKIDPTMTVENAIWKVRARPGMKLKGETDMLESKKKLQRLWSKF